MDALSAVSRRFLARIALGCVLAVTLLLPRGAMAQHTYDVVVYGGGLGGVAAAIQAKRAAPAGTTVAIFEPTDFLGGQMVASGVTSIDDDKQPACAPSVATCTYPAGIWGEFLHRVYTQYRLWPSVLTNPSAEPHVAHAILAQMAQSAGVDVYYGKTLHVPSASGNSVQTVYFEDLTYVTGKYHIDASEYGDLISVLGQSGYGGYRVGNAIGANYGVKVQNITFTAIMKKYPDGIPAAIDPLMAGPPPGYSDSLFSGLIDNSSGDGHRPYFQDGPYPFGFTFLPAYRYTPDTQPQRSINYYTAGLGAGQTRFSLNLTGVNDWLYSGGELLGISSWRPWTECDARLRTLQFIYYTTSKLGLPWSVANDEGYDTPRNEQAINACTNIPASWRPIAYHLPPMPYVRESVRGIGPYTLTGLDVFRQTGPFPTLRYFPTSVSTGGYMDDIHDNFYIQGLVQLSSLEPIDRGMAIGSTPIFDPVPPSYYAHFSTNLSGPFQIPYEALFSASMSNLIFAGKNISQTRVGNSATRVHGTEMRTGQAAGMIAALCLKETVSPAQPVYPVSLNPYYVQAELARAGQPVSGLNFTDVPLSHPRWWGVQIASASRLLTGGAGNGGAFNPDAAVTREQASAGIARRFAWPLNYRGDRHNDLPQPASQRFTDVPPSSIFYRSIDWMAAHGVTLGCAAALFCPTDPLSRRHLAAFMARAMNLSLNVPATVTDVSPSDPFYAYIQAVAYHDIVPSPNGIFDADRTVTRGELADALARSILHAMPPTGNPLQLSNTVPGS
jgi:hypothetical protein